MPVRERLVTVRHAQHAPRLSVLTPFYRYDPSPMLKRLEHAPLDVEFVLFDDGSGDAQLLANVIAAAHATGVAARVIVSERNRGRAIARNRLISEARGDYVLFLDADMIPDRASFLHTWLSVTRCQQPAVAFGGLSLRHATRTRATALHHNLFAASDCRSAEERAQQPGQFTASANLLVRRAFLADHPFDDTFTGWGFEDTDWALQASKHIDILHVDNPATHAGLDTAEALMRKSAEAGPNFARLAAKHPIPVSRFAAYRAALLLQLTPARTQVRSACAWLARDPLGATPMPVRRAALKLYRASHFAEHLA